eukprot:3271547-Ditylum_brightwellii.AAC.1
MDTDLLFYRPPCDIIYESLSEYPTMYARATLFTHDISNHFSYSTCNQNTWQGLRMHPLSWNVYGGHNEIVRLLLDAGARVNDDFDLTPITNEKVTVLDISEQLLENMGIDPNDTENKFVLTHQLLLEKGGKKFAELTSSEGGEL